MFAFPRALSSFRHLTHHSVKISEHTRVFIESRDAAFPFLFERQLQSSMWQGPSKWPLIEELAWNGVVWPDWALHHATLRRSYLRALGNQRSFRNGVYYDNKARQKAMKERYELAVRVLGYRPWDVAYPDLLEGDYLSPARMFVRLDPVPSKHVFKEYFGKSLTNHRLHSLQMLPPIRNYRVELEAAGLIVIEANIPPEARFEILSAAQVHECARRLGLERAPTALLARANLQHAAEHEPDKVIASLDGLFDPHDKFVYLPPSGLSWRDYQDIRVQVRGQALTIMDLSDGSASYNWKSGEFRRLLWLDS